MQKTVFLAAWAISDEPSGMQRAILKRANAIVSDAYKPVIVTFDFSLNYPQIERRLKAMGLLHDSVQIVNVYDDVRRTYDDGPVSAKQKAEYAAHNTKFEGDFWVEDAGHIARYFDNGVYVKFKRWADDGKIDVIDEFDDNRVRIQRKEFHHDGFLARETVYHPANNKRTQEHYYTKDGFCYATVWYNNDTGAQQGTYRFDCKFNTVEHFPHTKAWHIDWFEKFVNLEAVRPIIIAEQPSTVDRVLQMENVEADFIFTRHTGHVSEVEPLNYTKDAALLIDAISKGYPMVATSSSQGEHLRRHVGDRGNIIIVPDYYEALPTTTMRDPYRFVSVAHNRDPKLHDTETLVRAFADVYAVEKRSRLVVYGTMPKAVSKKVTALLKEHHIEKAVTFVDYTLAIDEVFAGAAAQVGVCNREGQSVATLGAMANGTPVIAYDCLFGPNEYVQHEKTGFLVEEGNEEALAQAMLRIVQQPEEARTLGEAARTFVEAELTKETYEAQWHDVLDHITEHMPRQPLL